MTGTRTRRRVATAIAAAMFVPLVAPFDPGVVAAPVGQGFELNASDLRHILKQIKIAEHHVANTTTTTGRCGALIGDGPNQIPTGEVGVTLPWGLRTVDGSCNNIVTGQATFGTADQNFPRIVEADFRPGYTPGTPATGNVVDPTPRVVSNLIVDQTANNPSAFDAAGSPEPTPSGALFIPNVATDTGLSAPYNSWFTLFGQFFDHGLDLVNKGGAGTVVIPLEADDPLFVEGGPNVMFLTRATHANGEANNQTSPWVDQSQTYTSHPSHQVFLREYDVKLALVPEVEGDPDSPLVPGKVPATPGSLIEGINGGMATWAEVKEQARTELGIVLEDTDVTNIPLILTDPYGNFIPGTNGFPQVVFPGNVRVEGNPGAPISVAGAVRTNHAFLDDIAHHAAPGGGKIADADPGTGDDGNSLTYDDEMLGAHFIAGDGRVNENIGLTTVHHVFHSEHNRLAEDIDLKIHALLTETEIDEWEAVSPSAPAGSGFDYAERLFQAARFVTEMEYQHLVFEEFARKVQPMVNLFGEGGTGYHTDINPAITAEFAHAVYRFGHSMLTETVDRTTPTGDSLNMDLLDAFLNPPSFWDGATSADNAAGNIVRGMTRQVGNELDEFITEAVRNRLLGLPLDLAALNIARGRDTGIPGLNAARREFFDLSGDTSLTPYISWIDMGFNLKHELSLINFIAAYGTHQTILDATTVAAKRAAAEELMNVANGGPSTPSTADALDFLESTGTWASGPDGVTTTGVDDIDLWSGGLAEKQIVFGGLLGPTFNFVFETQMENLQDGDRFYYLSRTAGLNLLTQLEGNSFAELIQRNTDVSGLPADSFSYPVYIFDLSAQNATGAILDDVATDYDERQLLVRSAGVIRYNGPEHVVFNGSERNDNARSSEGDDTMRGNVGNDRLEGGDGNDNLIGGDGDDILTDLSGDDVIKGGPGNDTISSGRGFGGDLNQGGTGDDFVIGGNDMTETFGGGGDDIVYAGDAEDTVFGDEGDDWIEGGQGPFALLQGDSGAPFQDDPNEAGHDVIIGYGGEQDYDSEGGDDIMFAGPGIQRAEGMLGFDWVTHKSDPVPGDSDMLVTALLPVAVDVNRDRFDLVESLSGWNKGDILRGDDRDAAAMTGHELDAAGIARISGLAGLLPVGATGFTGGNIILGGAGSDIIEGRGGDDLIDGDAWLDARLIAPHPTTGLPVAHDNLNTLRADVLAGRINPGAIDIERRIVNSSDTASVDTAVFSDLLENYTIVKNDDGTVTVAHVLGTLVDGVDTLRNVERLLFADGEVILGVLFNTSASGTLVISDSSPEEDQALTVAVTLDDPDGIPPTVDDGLGNQVPNVLLSWQIELQPFDWVTVAEGDTFTPDDGQVGFPLRVVATFLDTFGVNEQVNGTATAPVTNINDAPQGAPVIDNTAPTVDDTLTVDVSGIIDADGLPATLDIQWLSDGAPIAGANGNSFIVTDDLEGRQLSVAVSYVDLHGTLETVVSSETNPVVAPPVPELSLASASLNFGTRARNTAPIGQVILVTNTGNTALVVAPASLTGTNAASFTLADGCSVAPVAPGLNCTIGVSFLTTAVVGAKTATVQIPSNDPTGTKTVSLTGTLVNNTAATGQPAIDDTTPVEGQTLTASQGTIADADGITTATFSYQWQQNDIGGAGAYNDILGANTATFAPTDAQVNRRLRVRATFVDDRGSTQTLFAAGTQVVGDVFTGLAAAEIWIGTAQVDSASGGGGNDTLSALAGNDLLAGDGGDDTIVAGAGNDIIRFTGAAEGFDNVDGGTNADRIEAMANGTVIGLRTLSNVETITANGFSGVTISGSPDADTLNFGPVTLTGISWIIGGGGADTISGSAAADDIRGGDANDTLSGNGGIDTIRGGGGNDAITPGAGNDIIVVAPGDGADTVTGFDAGPPGGQDLLNISAFGFTAGNFAANVTITDVGADTLVTIGAVTIRLIGVGNATTITITDFAL